jgi:hypothetical protein
MMRIAMAAVLSVAASGTAFAGPGGMPTKPGLTEQARQIAYRRCWWHHGERHCRRVGDDNRIYRYGAGSPDDYRVGTAEWYRAMEREDRLNKPGRGR